MPRPNQVRTIQSETALARRIGYERNLRGMTPAGLASRMTKIGCPINASAIYKIEKADPPRRITVDELVAFSRVLGVPVEDLLQPPEVAVHASLSRLLAEWHTAQIEVRPYAARAHQAFGALRDYVAEHPDAAEVLEPILTRWAEDNFTDDAERRLQLGIRMHQLTGDPSWLQYADPEAAPVPAVDRVQVEGREYLLVPTGAEVRDT
jgi:transcriptional regulator with XRE-family HTH domain